jgi:bifunctional aspartokinase / homoserine dehydrogenase 1
VRRARDLFTIIAAEHAAAAMPVQRLVIKFGGTSVGHGRAIAAAAAIAGDLRRAGHPVVVVTSAMSGVTDTLLGAAAGAVRGERAHLREVTETLRAKHHAAAAELELSDEERGIVLDPIDQRLTEFAMLCDALAVLGEASPRALDAVSSLGERMSVHLLAGALRNSGTPALPVDAAEIVRTDDAFQSAAPDMSETRRLAQEMLSPMLEQGIVPVVTGFIGATVDGVVTTLGRGGSDYSAAVIGAVMDADEVWIYTDVDGVMTGDPRVVPEVRTLDTLSYREMSELAYFGAKVLHPKTVLPALERGIPIRIRNTFNPAHLGTLVVGRSDDPVAVFKGVTAIRHQSLVTIEGRGMLGVPGIAARAFGGVARTGTSVSMISQASSEQSICFLVPQDASPTVVDTLRREFDHELARRDIESIWALDEAVIVTVVGAAIKQTPGVAGRVFGALGIAGINVIAIAMGSSECSISLVVEAKDAEQTVKCLHTLI